MTRRATCDADTVPCALGDVRLSPTSFHLESLEGLNFFFFLAGAEIEVIQRWSLCQHSFKPLSSAYADPIVEDAKENLRRERTYNDRLRVSLLLFLQ